MPFLKNQRLIPYNKSFFLYKKFIYSRSNFRTINAIAPKDKKNMKIRNAVMVLIYNSLLYYINIYFRCD